MTMRALTAEAVGSFTVVLAICTTSVFLSPAGAGLVGVSMAAGLAVLVMSLALGHVSGGHFNPAVTLGLAAGGRFPVQHAATYIMAQVAGGLAAAAFMALVLLDAFGQGAPDVDFAAAANTFGQGGQYALLSAGLMEVVLSGVLIVVIMGATSHGALVGSAPLAIGFAVALFYLMAIPVSTGGLNPARSTAAAAFGGTAAVADLWLFWLAPLAGAALGGRLGRWLFGT